MDKSIIQSVLNYLYSFLLQFQTSVKWLMVLTISLILYITIRAILSLMSFFYVQFYQFNLHFNLLGLLIIINGLAYLAYLYPEAIQKSILEKSKYKFSSLDNADILDLKEKLFTLLTVDKVYLRQDLTPEYFASYLEITKNKFSQLLSNGIHVNFYDLVNSYRVEEAKRLLFSETYDSVKIMHVAYDSGFSNKSSFLRNFKKFTGQTPSDFKSNCKN